MIHAASLSDETKRDGAIAPNLIKDLSEINSLITDSEYDELKVYQTALNHIPIPYIIHEPVTITWKNNIIEDGDLKVTH